MHFGGYFTYGDFSSSTYNLVFAQKDTSEMLTPVSTKKYSTLRGRVNEKRYIYDSSYDDPLTFETEIFVCDGVLSESDSRTVCRALFNSNDYKWLKLRDSAWDGIHFNCVMILKEKIVGAVGSEEGVVGYKILILCDAPFAWEDNEQINIIQVSDGEEATLFIDNTSDYEKYTYPTVLVTQTNPLPYPTNEEFSDIIKVTLGGYKTKYADNGDGAYFDIEKDVTVIGTDTNGRCFDITNYCTFRSVVRDSILTDATQIDSDDTVIATVITSDNKTHSFTYYITFQESIGGV